MNYGGGVQRRFKRQAISQEGDVVIVSATRTHHQALKLKSGEIYNCKYGHFAHDDMIGQPFGSWILAKLPKAKQQTKHKEEAKNEIESSSKDVSNHNSNAKENDDHEESKTIHKESGKKRALNEEEKAASSKRGKAAIKCGELCLLRPTCELWTQSLAHRTQILYDADKSLITYLLQLKPNDIVFESGTGSGSLSTSISRTISPFGQLFTFEFNELRAEYARIDFQALRVDPLITVLHRNIVQHGFPNKKGLIQILNDIVKQYLAFKQTKVASEKQKKTEDEEDQDIDLENSNNKTTKEPKGKNATSQYTDSFGAGTKKIDEWSWLSDEKFTNLQHWIETLSKVEGNEFVNGVFLDLPKPWDAIKSACNVLKSNAKICSFSPCIEQVQRTCNELAINGFVDIRTFEVLSRDHLIRDHEFPALDLDTNNSYHDIRSRPPSEIEEDPVPTTRMMTSRPVGKTFGHTGYLTFAIKALPAV